VVRRSRRSNRKLLDHLESEERERALAGRVKAATNRKNRVSSPSMRAHDQRGPFVRCLIAFYGERAVQSVVANPEDVPGQLGRADEFMEYWKEWPSYPDRQTGPSAKPSSPTQSRAASVLTGLFR